ncbi:MAG: PLP-dependent aminotransferase family protein [candidate division FCPU426 bacterium]
MTEFEPTYSRFASGMKPSIIRALLKMVQRPDVISFAGGIPDAGLFPLPLFAELSRKAILEQGRSSLQYGETAGWTPLRVQLGALLAAKGIQADPSQILITNGSQQGIDLLGRILLDPGDLVGVENPAYLGALIAFNNFGARILPLPMDASGLIPEALEDAIRQGRKPKLLYLTPSFQNPSGRLLTLERRRRVVELAVTHGILIIEDDPYGDINFGGPITPLKALDATGRHVVYLGSFSKIGSPGMRLGWAAGPQDLIMKMTTAKESGDVCTNVLSQAIGAEFLAGGHLSGHLKNLVQVYRGRAAAMAAALRAEGSLSFEEPLGGFFIWASLPKGLKSMDLFERAMAAGVAYVPGGSFFSQEGEGDSTLRLTFCTADEDKIREGVKRLSAVIQGASVNA